jgi:hypothetical protein
MTITLNFYFSRKRFIKTNIYVYTLVHIYIVAYLLKLRIVEPEKQPLLGEGCVTRNNRVTIESEVLCAVCVEAI